MPGQEEQVGFSWRDVTAQPALSSPAGGSTGHTQEVPALTSGHHWHIHAVVSRSFHLFQRLPQQLPQGRVLRLLLVLQGQRLLQVALQGICKERPCGSSTETPAAKWPFQAACPAASSPTPPGSCREENQTKANTKLKASPNYTIK